MHCPDDTIPKQCITLAVIFSKSRQDQPGVICIGSKNFSESHWNCQLSQSPEPAGEIIQISELSYYLK